MRPPIAFCWSGGKDSALALHALRCAGEYDVVSLLTTLTIGFDRVSMHGVRRELLRQQADSLGIALEEVWIPAAASNVEYEAQMACALERYASRSIRTLAFGDIFLEDLRTYREAQLARAGLRALFPIWKRDTRALLESFFESGFRSIVCCIDTRVLDESFVGREIDRGFLRDLPEGVDPCGENGEFHSFAFAGPVFARPLEIERGECVRRDSFLFCDLLPKATQGPTGTTSAGSLVAV